ncbi:MAG: hypothetical protein HYX23_00365 [Candidatus Zambryskibacteria bacterium]|nr:hypothetical protein [Candidatus Zambryskibacteria bacterium]
MTGIKDLITAVGSLINPLIVILVGVALLVFIWGLIKFIFRVGGDENAIEGGKQLMIWGLIALFVMISVWGIIRLVQIELNLPAGGSSSLPTSGTNSNYVFPSDNSIIWTLE